MGLYIEKMELPKGGNETIIRILPNGKILDQYGHHLGVSALSVPPHGRLIDESKISLKEYEQAAHDALHKGKGSILYDSGVLAGARAITRLVRNAPTVIGAEEGET